MNAPLYRTIGGRMGAYGVDGSDSIIHGSPRVAFADAVAAFFHL